MVRDEALHAVQAFDRGESPDLTPLLAALVAHFEAAKMNVSGYIVSDEFRALVETAKQEA